MPAKLGIIAGSGQLPGLILAAARQQAQDAVVLAVEGAANTNDFKHVPCFPIRLAAVGETLRILKREHVGEVVLAGGVKRPTFRGLIPDLKGAKLLARITAASASGDDAVLAAVVAFLEDEGFRVIGPEEVLKDLLARPGLWGKHHPAPADRADVQLGVTVAKTLGRLDVGQAVAVSEGRVLAVEAAEGTQAMLARTAGLPHDGGVLIKVKKPAQERRADLPAIGPETVDQAHAAKLRGIAVEAGHALVIDRASVIDRADALGLFVMGVDA